MFLTNLNASEQVIGDRYVLGVRAAIHDGHEFAEKLSKTLQRMNVTNSITLKVEFIWWSLPHFQIQFTRAILVLPVLATPVPQMSEPLNISLACQMDKKQRSVSGVRTACCVMP